MYKLDSVIYLYFHISYKSASIKVFVRDLIVSYLFVSLLRKSMNNGAQHNNTNNTNNKMSNTTSTVVTLKYELKLINIISLIRF